MQYLIIIFFFHLGFLSQPFTNHRTARERGGHFFNSSLPLPTASTSTTTTSAPHYLFHLITFHRNQSIELLCTSIDWFLYDRDFLHERVNLRFTDDFAIFWDSVYCWGNTNYFKWTWSNEIDWEKNSHELTSKICWTEVLRLSDLNFWGCSAFYLSILHCKKTKFSVKDFFSKCDQMCRKLQIWSHLLKKSLVENFIFCPC